MDLTQWASVFEIAASVAIVVSLVFVGRQIHDNTRAVRAGTHQSLLDHMRETSAMLVTHPEVAELVEKGKRDPGPLTEVERTRFYEFANLLFSAYEASYYNNLNGLLDAEVWDSWEDYFKNIPKTPGYVTYFQQNDNGFIKPFKDYFESKIEKP